MRKIKQKDFDHIAEYIIEERKRRKKNRSDLEKIWKQLDRQVEMRPDISHKCFPDSNTRDPQKAWLPEFELPLQAEALETLMSDTREMMFPSNGTWFLAHAAVTDEYLAKADFTSIITGDENEIPSQITQDNADKLAGGFIDNFHGQYDFRGHIDLINAEVFTYGTGIGRARTISKELLMNTAKGLIQEKRKFPVLVPRSIKETYLDDRLNIVMHEGYMAGPLTIFERRMAYDDLKDIIKKGNRDPESENGGWYPPNFESVEKDNNGMVDLVEAEGDFIIPRKTTGSIVLPGTIVTVVCGKNNPQLIRIRFRKHTNSVIPFSYHREKINNPYATSPLIKGWPLQAAAVEMLSRVVESAALKTQPPVGYDRSDLFFAAQGGPGIFPGAVWGTIGELIVHDKFGDPASLYTIYQGILDQYADVVGMHRARLGAQTLSHTTAYAKEVELQRGAVRTVDYVRSALAGPMTQWLSMEYQMGLDSVKGEYTFYIDAYRGFVTIERKHLPEQVVFEAHGAGTPSEELRKKQEKMASLQLAIQMDQAAIQAGNPPTLNMPGLIQDTLRDGGWVDTDPYINRGNMNQMPAAPMMEEAGMM